MADADVPAGSGGGPGGAAAGHPLISVCVCTFRRPALLRRLLDALAGQRLVPSYEVIVVDNDRLGSAAPAIEAARVAHPRLALRDALVPEQNIALARNRAVALARGQLLAFIDDDERPVARWLGTLLRALERFSADGVLGPVLPELPESAPAWVARGRFFDRPRHPSGVEVPATELRTGNVILRRALLLPRAGDGRSDEDGPFDPRWGLSGGEDSALLVELRARGARFVWCDDALVHEHVPEERARLSYLLRRAFAGGCGFARFRLAREGLRTAPSLLWRGALDWAPRRSWCRWRCRGDGTGRWPRRASVWGAPASWRGSWGCASRPTACHRRLKGRAGRPMGGRRHGTR